MEQSSNAGASATNQKRAPEHKPDRAYLLRRLWVYFREHRWMLLLAVLLTLGGNLLALVGPKLSGLAIDAIGSVPGRVDFPTVLRYAGYMALCYILSAGMNYGLRRLMIRLSRQVVYRMRRDLFNHLVSLPIGFFDRRQAGDVISILSYDVDTINASLSEDIVHICTSCITVIGALFMMLSISPVLILVFAVSIPISFLITRYRAKRVRPLFRLRSKKLGELNGFVEEITGGQRTTKAYHREQAVIDRFDVKNGETVQAYAEADYYACAIGAFGQLCQQPFADAHQRIRGAALHERRHLSGRYFVLCAVLAQILRPHQRVCQPACGNAVHLFRGGTGVSSAGRAAGTGRCAGYPIAL